MSEPISKILISHTFACFSRFIGLTHSAALVHNFPLLVLVLVAQRWQKWPLGFGILYFETKCVMNAPLLKIALASIATIYLRDSLMAAAEVELQVSCSPFRFLELGRFTQSASFSVWN